MNRGYWFLIIAVVLIVSFSYFFYFKDVGLSPSGTSAARARIINRPPSINFESVSPDPLIFLPRTNEAITVRFRAQDPDGLSNLNNPSAFAKLDFTAILPTEPVRRSTAPCTFTDQGNQRTYTCIINFEYYAAPGSWSLVVGVSDLATNPLNGTYSQVYNVPLSKHVTLNPSNPGAFIEFPDLVPGGLNVMTTAPTAIRNDGNYEGEIKISASDLAGELVSTELIPAINFNAGGTSAANVCTTGSGNGNRLDNTGVPISIQSSFLPRGPAGSDLETISYCITSVPQTLSSQLYSTEFNAGGVPWTIGI